MNFERIIGSSHENAPDIFPNREEKEASFNDVEKEWLEKEGIPENIQERINRLFSDNELALVSEVSPQTPEIRYPTACEWLKHRMKYHRGTKFYPCFVKDETGDTRFMKVDFRGGATLDSLRSEAKLMSTFDNELRELGSPRMLQLIDPTEDTPAAIIIESISMNEGQVATSKNMTPDHVADMAKKIRYMESIDVSASVTQHPEIKNLSKARRVNEEIRDLANRSGNIIHQDVKEKVASLFLGGPELPIVFAHGDLTLKNVMNKNDGTVSLVDWELAGVGFWGQDAGKFYKDIRTNPENREIFQKSYFYDESGTLDIDRVRGLFSGIVVENLVHLVWRAENADLLDPKIQNEVATFRSNIENAISEYESITSNRYYYEYFSLPTLLKH